MIVTDIETVEAFLDKYYKHSRYRGRGQEYADCVLESHKESFEKYGYTLASRHESVTGEAVWFFKQGGAPYTFTIHKPTMRVVNVKDVLSQGDIPKCFTLLPEYAVFRVLGHTEQAARFKAKFRCQEMMT